MSIVNRWSRWPLLGLCLTSICSKAHAVVPSSTFVTASSQFDSGANLTVSLNVPSTNTNDDLYFSFSAPRAQSWAAFGFGNAMADALIFVVYASQDGKNITLSPRTTASHAMPIYESSIGVDLLPGSGIIADTYVVHARCTSCRSWNTISVASTTQNMIWAVGDANTAIASDDLNVAIQRHSQHGGFSLNLQAATGAAGVPNNLNLNSPQIQPTGPGSDNTDGPPSTAELDNVGPGYHGLVMIGAFLVLFPAGYLCLRVFEKLWLHWGVQSLAVVLVLIGAAGGISLSIKDHMTPNFHSAHQIFGLMVVFLVLVTWSIGLLGHRLYKLNGKAGVPTTIHRVLGPLTMSFGLINACLGFSFAGNGRAISGFAITTILMIVFVGALVYLKQRRVTRKGALNTPAALNFRAAQQDRHSGPPPEYSAAAHDPSHLNSQQHEQAVPLQTWPRDSVSRPPIRPAPSYDGSHDEHQPRAVL